MPRHLGYLVAVGPYTLFHSGDAIPYDGMESRLLELAGERSIDVALLPINGRLPSGACRATSGATRRCASRAAIGARLVVPMHYEMFAFNTETPELFESTARALGQPYRVLRCGERLTSSRPDRGGPPCHDLPRSRYTVETITVERVAKTIDHSLLKPELTVADVLAGCDSPPATTSPPCAAGRSTCCAAATPSRAPTSLSAPSSGSRTAPNLTATKVFEAQQAMEDGAVELDMVIAIGMLRSGELGYVRDDIAAVVEAAGDGAIVKVILENAFLTDDEKVAGCEVVEGAGAAYVKTSTGYAPTGATLEDLRLMRATVSPPSRSRRPAVCARSTR